MSSSLVFIEDVADPRIAGYRALRDRDARREGDFVAEGENVVRVLASSRFTTRSLLLEERRVTAMQDVIEKTTAPVYVCKQLVMDAITGFAIHRGILGLGQRRDDTVADVLANAKLVVGLVGITNHDNVGGIFRNAAAFGADAVLIDGPTCDPLYRKAVRVSVGGALVVPFARTSDVLAALDGFETFALTPRAEETIEVLRGHRNRRALLLGTEGEGLPEDVMSRTRRVRIAMSSRLDSLNVSVASALALHETTR